MCIRGKHRQNVVARLNSLDLGQDLQRIMSRSLDFLYSGTSSVSGLQIDCDYLVVTKTIETQLLAWRNEWQNFRRYVECELSLCQMNDTYTQYMLYYTACTLVSNSHLALSHF